LLDRRAATTWGAALALSLVIGPISTASGDDGETVVRAILFYSPGCGHCHYVMEEVLPPLMEQYGGGLEIQFADVATAGGSDLYQSTMLDLGVPRSRWVVPILVCGDVMLVGSQEIPELFPALIEEGLAAGGGEAAAGGIIGRDMLGNAIAVGVLCGMVLAVGIVTRDGVRALGRRGSRPGSRTPSSGGEAGAGTRGAWLVPALCVYGLLVSGYLSYVEIAEVEAVCGPVGDCNAVQRSEYALLFGMMPVAVVGVLGYAALLVTWTAGRLGRGTVADVAPALLLGLAGLGTLLSICLTFLEPFVLGATCLWCLTVAVDITLVLLLVAPVGWGTLSREVRRLRS
jgi:uncharacterized membrane protein